jgi:type VI protein secretion system component VasK
MKAIGAALKALIFAVLIRMGGVMGFMARLILPKLFEIGWSVVEKWVEYRRLKADAQAKNEKTKEAAEELKAANEIKDQDGRLNAKADKLCKIEKINNPSSDCDQSGPR